MARHRSNHMNINTVHDSARAALKHRAEPYEVVPQVRDARLVRSHPEPVYCAACRSIISASEGRKTNGPEHWHVGCLGRV
jgi:hypothetical protein